MRRNKSFLPSHEPLNAHESLEIQHEKTHGPFSFFNPTRTHFRHKDLSGKLSDPTSGQDTTSSDEEKGLPNKDEDYASDVHFQWRSRDNRKGRHALVVDSSNPSSKDKYIVPKSTHTSREIMKGIWRMCTVYPVWDVSYLVATIFTLGSVVWVINAFFVWLPLVDPATEFPNEITSGGGISAFIGATIFEVGSILLMFEAVNENRAGCFGWALEQVLEDQSGRWRIRPDKGQCSHHHHNKNNFVGEGANSQALSSPSDSEASQEKVPVTDPNSSDKRTWQWFPTWHELSTHYFREIGFLASFFQLLGASIFWISGFTALPSINISISNTSQGLLDGIYWVPQVVGGSGFIISGILFMLETQKNWYTPAFKVLGWHIGFWNLVGAIGFTLSGALGMAYASSGAQYEAALSTWWGSWAFLIGSVIQWYESLDTHPVEEKGKDDP